MTVRFTTEEILYATGGRLFAGSDSGRAGSLAWEPEKVREGDWFVALAEGSVDTHDSLDDAISRGAVGCIVNRRPWYQTTCPDVPLITVADTKTAIFELLRYFRHRAGLKIVGVSGTDGRRATMLILSALLQSRYKTHSAFMQSMNWLSCTQDLLNTPADCDLLIFECSAVERGEIARMASALEPDLAVITQIKHPLPSAFRSSQIAATYCELLSGLNHSRAELKAVVYDEDSYVHARAGEIMKDMPARFFSESGKSIVDELPEMIFHELSATVQRLIGVPARRIDLWCAVEAALALGGKPEEVSRYLAGLAPVIQVSHKQRVQ